MTAHSTPVLPVKLRGSHTHKLSTKPGDGEPGDLKGRMSSIFLKNNAKANTKSIPLNPHL